jgi:hypothetical protein
MPATWKLRPEKVAQKSSQGHEIIGSRKLVRGLHRGCQLRRRSAEQEGARDGVRDGRFRWLTRHHDPRANPRALIKVDHVLVRHADAARRNRMPDRIRFIGAMDSIECARKIHGARAERMSGPPSI